MEGLMFDVSRHFFTVTEVKQFIDEMVKSKYNLLHLHSPMTKGEDRDKKPAQADGSGFRRVERVGTFGTFAAPGKDEPLNSAVFIRRMISGSW